MALFALTVWFAWPTVWGRYQAVRTESAAATYRPADATAWLDLSSISDATPEAAAFAQAVFPTQLTGSEDVLFLHRLSRPDGEWRIVALRLTAGYFGVGTTYYVRTPSGIFSESRTPVSGSETWPANTWHAREGQADPNDPTHFTIDIKDDAGGERFVDGWLGNDDRVRLEVREHS